MVLEAFVEHDLTQLFYLLILIYSDVHFSALLCRVSGFVGSLSSVVRGNPTDSLSYKKYIVDVFTSDLKIMSERFDNSLCEDVISYHEKIVNMKADDS